MYDEQEVQARLAEMDDSQIETLTHPSQRLPAGGDSLFSPELIIAVLIIVLLVILILKILGKEFTIFK